MNDIKKISEAYLEMKSKDSSEEINESAETELSKLKAAIVKAQKAKDAFVVLYAEAEKMKADIEKKYINNEKFVLSSKDSYMEITKELLDSPEAQIMRRLGNSLPGRLGDYEGYADLMRYYKK